MIAFFTKCLETALKEPLGLELTEPCGSLPAGTYAFVEYYCANLECNCQRVTLCVYASTDSEMRNCLAQHGFGWESPAFYTKWRSGMPPSAGKRPGSAFPGRPTTKTPGFSWLL